MAAVMVVGTLLPSSLFALFFFLLSVLFFYLLISLSFFQLQCREDKRKGLRLICQIGSNTCGMGVLVCLGLCIR